MSSSNIVTPSNAPVIAPEAFHGLFGRITEALDPYTEASKVGVMVSLMSAYSAYIGFGPSVETGKGSSPLALWSVLVGRSGKGRKGTATGMAMRVIEAAFAQFAEESVVQGLPATGLGLITELSDRAEGTLANPVLFLEEEGDALLSNARRDAKLGVYLRKAFDAQTIAHKTRMDDLRIRRPHLGLIMHVQPKNWAAVAGGKDATGGTWNRVLPVWVEQSKTLPVFESGDAHDAIRSAARALRQAGDYARQVDMVTVPAHVAQMFESKHRPIVEAMISTEAMSQYAERAMAYMIRLAGIMALSERRDEISERDFNAALALVTYSIQTISYVLPEAEASEETAMSVRLENYIKEAGTAGRTATDIYRALSIKATDLHDIVAQLDTIESAKGESKGAGRKPVIYRYSAPEDVSEETGLINVSAPEGGTVEAPDVIDVMNAHPATATPVSHFLTDDEWADVDAALTQEAAAAATPEIQPAPEPVTINPDLPQGVDALRAFFQSLEEPETAPEPEPVEEVTEEPAIFEDVVKAYLASPAGAELLQGILAQMLATQAPAPKPARKRPARIAA